MIGTCSSWLHHDASAGPRNASAGRRQGQCRRRHPGGLVDRAAAPDRIPDGFALSRGRARSRSSGLRLREPGSGAQRAAPLPEPIDPRPRYPLSRAGSTAGEVRPVSGAGRISPKRGGRHRMAIARTPIESGRATRAASGPTRGTPGPGLAAHPSLGRADWAARRPRGCVDPSRPGRASGLGMSAPG